MLHSSITRIMEIEASIKKIDPNFTSGHEDLHIQTIRNLEEN